MKPWMVAHWCRISVPSRVKNGNWSGIHSRQSLVNRKLPTAGQMEGALPESRIMHKFCRTVGGLPRLGARAHKHSQTECNRHSTKTKQFLIQFIIRRQWQFIFRRLTKQSAKALRYCVIHENVEMIQLFSQFFKSQANNYALKRLILGNQHFDNTPHILVNAFLSGTVLHD